VANKKDKSKMEELVCEIEKTAQETNCTVEEVIEKLLVELVSCAKQ